MLLIPAVLEKRMLMYGVPVFDNWVAGRCVQAMDKAQESIVVAALTRFLSQC